MGTPTPGRRTSGEDPPRQSTTRLRPALRAWADAVVDQHCRIDPDGSAELICTQAELARRLGHQAASGSISRRFGELRRCGVLLPGKPVRFDLCALGRSVGPAAVTADPESGHRDRAIDDLARGFRILVESGATELARHTLSTLDVLTRVLHAEPAPGPRHLSAGSAPGTRQPARDSVEEVFEGSLSPSRATTACPVDEQPLSPSPRRPGSQDARRDETGRATLGNDGARTTAYDVAGVARKAAGSRAPETDGRDRELTRLLEPVLAECRSRGLPGVTNRSGLREALGRYDDDAIGLAASFLAEQLRAGATLRSPVGVLVAAARSGDLPLLARRIAPAGSFGQTGGEPTTVDPAHQLWAPAMPTAEDRRPGQYGAGPQPGPVRADPLWDLLAALVVDDPRTVTGLAGTGAATPARAALVQAYLNVLTRCGRNLEQGVEMVRQVQAGSDGTGTITDR